MKRQPALVVILAITACVLGGELFAPGLLRAQTVEKNLPFKLGDWISLDVERTPIILHRLRLVRSNGGIASRIARNQQYDQQVELELEFSNSSSQDWKGRVTVEWLDASGDTIEGIETKFELDDHETRSIRKERSSANRYGLEHARKLRLSIELNPD